MRTREFESLVKKRCRSGDFTFPEALHFFHDLLHFRDPPPSIITFNFLFASMVRMGNLPSHYPTILSLFNPLARPHPRAISPDACTYCICIDCCTRVNQVDLGFVLLGRFLKDKRAPDTSVFNPLLKCLCRNNRIAEAAAMLFDKMPNLGCPPNLISYNTLIKGYCSAGKTSSATELLEKMIGESDHHKPNVITFSTVIDGLCKEGSLSKAFDLFEQMHSLGVLPNTITYNTLINGLCKQGPIEKALVLLNHMASKGLEPDIVTYTTLVDGLCKKGLLENPGKLLQYIIYKGHKPNVVTYNAVIDALCKNEEIEKAEELLNDMTSRGVQPDVAIYNTLMDGLCKINKLENAMNWLDKMDSNGVSPNIVTYTIFMNALCKEGETDKVEELLDDMISRGVQPNVVTYTTLLVGFCKMKELESVKKCLREMVSRAIPPSIVTWNIIIDAFCSTDDAMNILVSMVLNHGAQGNSACISLIKAYVKRGNIDEAMSVLKRMKQAGLKPDIDAYSPIKEMLLEMGRADDAKDLMAQMSEKKADD
ncbi:Pentatricopeptide repeat (PPR) superfamily protein [Rhynchospora pubera]|uniref:Pentatricopeptide repeat (PPR) superfamily protein n=1 Tax=Rhynchospora pubera TaxID=906938 RepID=A0AAV8FS94_9POAL|nr:Pentatricopeptide repeat (PPR) superfamily protein [Rhynchospora pubera]